MERVFGRIAVTGAGGLLGFDMCKALMPHAEQLYAWKRAELDVTDLDAVLAMFLRCRPEAVVHAAAYTKIDMAESEPDLAFKANAIGTRNVALAAETVGAKMVYISTDNVFPGTGDIAWNECRETQPINVYGSTKRAGEWLAASLLPQLFIVRTSWLFGEGGPNFVETMLNLAKRKAPIRAVGDQIGSPTYAADLAQAIVRLLATEKYGTYHIANSGSCSWYEFAEHIFELAGIDADLAAVTSAEFKRPAARPPYSVLDPMALRINGFPPMRAWKDALREYMGRRRQLAKEPRPFEC